MKEQLLKLQEVFTKAKGVSVELGAIDDVVKYHKDILKKLLEKRNKAMKIAKEIEGLEDYFEDVLRQANPLEQSVKDLGIKMPKELKEVVENAKTDKRRVNVMAKAIISAL